MKSRILLVIFLAILIIPTIVVAKPRPSNPCPIKSDTNIVFYGETGFGGVGQLSRSWIIHFLNWWKEQDSSIDYVELDSSDIKKDCNLASFPNLKIYIQPGGNAYYQQRKLELSGKNNILNFINTNKTFLGICAGFYYAAADYYWQDQYYAHPYLLKIYPTVEGSIREIADYDESPGYALTQLSNGRNVIYYGGPTRGYKYTPSDFLGIADSFFIIPKTLPAIIKYNNILLSSVHLEAYENDGISGLATEDRIENYKYLANLLNDVAKTNFYVPPYEEPAYPPQPGNETNYSDSVVLFYDSFESGSLSQYSLTSVSGGNLWKASTSDPYQGSYYAESQPMSTTEPASILQKTISTLGYSNINIGYYRKLVGLDTADEFKVKWFDGISWFTLEETGSSSANDASYIYKEFSLPASANNNSEFAIRFECTAGAVSEFCRIDNLKIVAQ